MKPVIELHIEEIVLQGFPSLNRQQRCQIHEILQQRLTGLLTCHGLPSHFMQGCAIQRLDGGSFQSAVNTCAPGDIGANIAGNVYRVLSGSRFSKGAYPKIKGKGGNRP